MNAFASFNYISNVCKILLDRQSQRNLIKFCRYSSDKIFFKYSHTQNERQSPFLNIPPRFCLFFCSVFFFLIQNHLYSAHTCYGYIISTCINLTPSINKFSFYITQMRRIFILNQRTICHISQ